MRIGVLSDTHGRVNIAMEAIKEMASIDLLIHAGDYYEDAMSLKSQLSIPVEAVKGNCDYFIDAVEDKIIEVGGKKIFLTHGHKFNVKRNMLNLKYKGQELGVEIVVFGHTHVPEIIKEHNLLLFNPGSLALPRIAKNGTYGIIDIVEAQIVPQIKDFKIK